jgi:outer membrane murein-binding lipoprotein Lpp
VSTKQTAVGLGWCAWMVAVAAGAMLGGCGYTDLEMAAKQRQIDKLARDLNALKTQQESACKAPAPAKPQAKSGPALSSR